MDWYGGILGTGVWIFGDDVWEGRCDSGPRNISDNLGRAGVSLTERGRAVEERVRKGVGGLGTRCAALVGAWGVLIVISHVNSTG